MVYDLEIFVVHCDVSICPKREIPNDHHNANRKHPCGISFRFASHSHNLCNVLHVKSDAGLRSTAKPSSRTQSRLMKLVGRSVSATLLGLASIVRTIPESRPAEHPGTNEVRKPDYHKSDYRVRNGRRHTPNLHKNRERKDGKDDTQNYSNDHPRPAIHIRSPVCRFWPCPARSYVLPAQRCIYGLQIKTAMSQLQTPSPSVTPRGT